jgi:hypothetical protein
VAVHGSGAERRRLVDGNEGLHMMLLPFWLRVWCAQPRVWQACHVGQATRHACTVQPRGLWLLQHF